MKNKILIILLLVCICFTFVNSLYAKVEWTSDGIYNGNPNTSHITNADDMKAVTTVQEVWNTIRFILQIASVSAFIFAGVRYMFASADQKADIKKSMSMLAIGAVLVFGATFVIGFIQDVVEDLTGF